MNEEHTSPLLDRPAPDFTLPRTGCQFFSLRDLRGRPVVLLFYPGDWDPVSSEQLRLYEELLPELKRFDATLAAVSVDSVWSHAAFRRALGLSYPLLSDFQPKGEVARAYEVYREGEGRSGRALFLVDSAGVIRWSRSVPANLNPGGKDIVRALQTLHFTDPPPAGAAGPQQ